LAAAIVAERREGSRIAGVERRPLRRRQGREETYDRVVCRSDDRSSTGRAPRRAAVDVDRCVTALDTVVGVEDGGVKNRPEPLAGRVRRIGRNQCVDEDLVPFQYLVDWSGLLRSRLYGFDWRRNDKAQPDQ